MSEKNIKFGFDKKYSIVTSIDDVNLPEKGDVMGSAKRAAKLAKEQTKLSARQSLPSSSMTKKAQRMMTNRISNKASRAGEKAHSKALEDFNVLLPVAARSMELIANDINRRAAEEERKYAQRIAESKRDGK